MNQGTSTNIQTKAYMQAHNVYDAYVAARENPAKPTALSAMSMCSKGYT